MTSSAPIGLQDLPNEILDDILKYLALDTQTVLAYDLHEPPAVLTGTGLKADRLEAFWRRREDGVSTFRNMCLVSRHMREIATGHLYRNVAIRHVRCLLRFLRTLVEHARLRIHVKCLMLVDDMARCHEDEDEDGSPRILRREVRRGHQGTDSDSRIFKLFGGIQRIPRNPQYEPWSKWCPYSKGYGASPGFPSEHAVVGVLLCLVKSVEQVSLVSTWLRSCSGDEEELRRNLLDAMADPVLSQQGVLAKLHTLELNPTVDDSLSRCLGAALLRVPSLRTVNMCRSLHPRPASMDGAEPPPHSDHAPLDRTYQIARQQGKGPVPSVPELPRPRVPLLPAHHSGWSMGRTCSHELCWHPAGASRHVRGLVAEPWHGACGPLDLPISPDETGNFLRRPVHVVRAGV
ncbi:hypothetical protein PG993_013403 [Apiospora rasikravindrae]|uniref:F-box domain-containing protein n=1 Tax=Apiospora rasikravindrae TaxID=990691 RepID=A0ABR1RXJ9_9PEZI